MISRWSIERGDSGAEASAGAYEHRVCRQTQGIAVDTDDGKDAIVWIYTWRAQRGAPTHVGRPQSCARLVWRTASAWCFSRIAKAIPRPLLAAR